MQLDILHINRTYLSNRNFLRLKHQRKIYSFVRRCELSRDLDGVFKSSSLEPTHTYFGFCGLQGADDRKCRVFLWVCFHFCASVEKSFREFTREHQSVRYASRSLLYNFPFMCALLSTRGFNFQPCDIVKIAVGIL